MTRARAVAVLVTIVALIVPALPSGADTPVGIGPGRWEGAGGGDNYRTGYNPFETAPYFIGGRVDQPNPEWVTKLTDFPSGLFLMGGLVVAEGKVILGAGSTNSVIALDQDSGLPVWRFQPDPRGSRYNPGDGYSGGYPGTNAPQYVDGVLYVTFSNGTLYALDAGTGQKIWRWEVPANGAPGEAIDSVIPPGERWDCNQTVNPNASDCKHPLRPEVAPYTGDYPKFHSAVGYCAGKVYVETLDARLYAIRSSDGTTIWHRYVGAPDWAGEFKVPEYAKGGIVPKSGRSTRRFEAQPGPGCLRSKWVFVPTEDGFVKTFDANTGRFIKAYDFWHEGDLGFAHDGGAGLADPRSGTLIVNSLNNRMVRLSVPGMKPLWAHPENGGQLSICADRVNRTGCAVIPTSQNVEQDGPIGGAVFGGNLSLDWEHNVIANANQDGHLYIYRRATIEDANPPLVKAVPTAHNPYSKKNPKPASVGFYTPDDGKNGPWVHRTAVLQSSVMGGGVVYFAASWEHAIYGVKYMSGDTILKNPKVVFRYQVKWDKSFQYPPFGDRYRNPIVDIDLLTLGSPALVDGHLYAEANDGSVYSFDLHNPNENTVKNLALLGSGLVPFLPKWTEGRGAFDRVWTPADWYKNQNAPKGFRLPSPGALIPLGLPVALIGLWLVRRRRMPAGAPAPSAQRPGRNHARRRREGHWWP